MSEKALKAATIGCGRMGGFCSPSSKFLPAHWHPITHLESLKKLHNVESVFAVDPNIQVRARVQGEYGIKAYDSVEDLFSEHPDIDVLTIATRTPLKFELIKCAYDLGIRLFHVEKPLCNSVSELHKLEYYLSNSSMTYGCLRRYLSPFNDIESVAETNDLGKLTVVQTCMGNSMLYWTHAHSIDYLLMQIKSSPISVQAVFDSVDFCSETNTLYNDPFVRNASVYFENGEVGLISSLPGNNFINVYEKGQIAVKKDGHEVVLSKVLPLEIYPSDFSLSIPPTQQGATYSALELLVNSHIPKNKLKVDSIRNAAILGQRIMFAMVESHLRGGKEVFLSEEIQEFNLKGLFNGVPA